MKDRENVENENCYKCIVIQNTKKIHNSEMKTRKEFNVKLNYLSLGVSGE